MPPLTLPTISPDMGDIFWLLSGPASVVSEMLGALETYFDLVPHALEVRALCFGLVLGITVPLHHLLSFHSYGVGRLVTRRPIGCYAKCAVDVFTVCAAVFLRHFLPYNNFSLLSLVGFTVDFHAFSQIRHVASDLNIWDMLLGVLMQVLVYIVGKNICAYVAVLVVCGGVILYRFWSYKTPTTANDVDNDLEKIPSLLEL